MHKRNPSSRVWLDIDGTALCRNFDAIATRVSPCRVMAVLKANAYGLGLLPVARALAEAGVYGFGVAEIHEALALVPLGRPVQILGGILPDEIEPAVRAGIRIPIPDHETAAAISRISVRLQHRSPCHFLVDTGMGRLGILQAEALPVILDCLKWPGLTFEGLYSHFPAAYRGDMEITRRQIRDFTGLIAALEARGVCPPLRHIANSDAVNNVPEAFRPPFNMVRTGINLHGAFDSEGRRALNLQPVLTLKTRLAAVRNLPAGMTLGYGCSYVLPRPMRIGTIAAGYADGLPLALSNRGHVLIRNRPCPVLGRVSMDYTTVALDCVPDAMCGDEVVCLGGTGPEAPDVESWAMLKGTNPYDIICAFGNRVQRRFLPPAPRTADGSGTSG